MSLQYIVSWAQSATGPFGTPNQNTVSSPTDTISGLQPGTGYYFQIVTQDTVTMLSGAPVVVGPVTTTGTSVSPSGTVVGTFVGAATQIVDSAQYTWTLSGGQIYYQPPGGSVTLIGATGAVIALVYYNGAVYQWAGTTAPGNWWSTPPGNPAFATNLGATVPIPASPSGTSIPPSSWIVDTSGNIWFYETPSGGSTGNEIYINGIVSTAPSGGYPTAFVTQMVWAGGTLYQFGSGAWYSLVPTASEVNNPTWVASAAPTGIFINTVVSQIQNQPFAVSGVLSGYTATPTLNYMDITNGVTGSWLALPSGATVSTTSFSFTNPAISVVNTNNSVAVRDTGVLFTGTSTQFPVVSPPTITSIQINGGSTGSFPADSAIGTIIGTLGVTTNTSGFTFNGTYSLPSGVANNADFEIVSGNMLAVANASLPTATYTARVAATQAGITNSPYTQTAPSFTITATASSPVPITPPLHLPTGWQVAFFDDFTSASTITSTSSSLANGYNWYSNMPTNVSNIYTTDTAASISNGNTGAGTNASTAGGIFEILGSTTTYFNGNWQTCPASPGAGQTGGNGYGWGYPVNGANGQPNYWKHAYFEAYMQWNTAPPGGTVGQASNGWFPAFWSNAVGAVFTGSISGSTLTVSNLIAGTIVSGQTILATGVTLGTTITGGGGTSWTVSTSQTVASQTMSTNGNATDCEVDFIEMYEPQTTGTKTATDWGIFDPAGDPTGTEQAGFTNTTTGWDNNWHTVGCLWTQATSTTGTMTFYIDGNVQGSPVTVGAGTAVPHAETNAGLFLMMGTGYPWPVYVDWVRVWTATG